MKTLFQIGSSLNYGAPGKIAEQIGIAAHNNGWCVYMAHGNKYKNASSLLTYQTVTPIQEHWHEAFSLLFDKHGLSSTKQTKILVERIADINPDIIHLHNIHGYFLNYQILFEFLKTTDIPIIWTLHDCWPFTGHCSHFDFIGCNKWKTGCNNCPGLNVYPKSLLIDRSRSNYVLKKQLFSSVADRLTLVPVSDWIARFAKESFLSGASIQTIHNGIDLAAFSPRQTSDLKKKYSLDCQIILLGVASPWTETKGLYDWVKLYELLPQNKFKLILIGLNKKQIRALPQGIIKLGHTNSAEELAQYYSMADVFLNTTYQDNYPTVNLEALACGTPVITYDTGGSPEAITSETGWVVDKGDIGSVVRIVESLSSLDIMHKHSQRIVCRKVAEERFDKDTCFKAYLHLYEALFNIKSHN